MKFDVETEEPIRGPDGFCIEADPDEVGEAIGLIGDAANERFEGYNDPEQTKKKVLEDVFAPGDRWFRTGDLLKKDARGYIYFIDRIGDTFRWKSENVSTNEVGEVLSSFDGIKTANVYGVPIESADGKAGMASVTTNGDVDLPALKTYLERELPAYARPLFIRVQPEAETTGTFKYRKVELVNEGFDPEKVSDPLFFLSAEEGFIPIDTDLYRKIQAGEVKL